MRMTNQKTLALAMNSHPFIQMHAGDPGSSIYRKRPQRKGLSDSSLLSAYIDMHEIYTPPASLGLNFMPNVNAYRSK